MSTRDYPRLTIHDFGRQLLESGDLDPVYLALHRMKMPGEQLSKWLVAYWCFYSAGTACWMSEFSDKDYWYWMLKAAANDAQLTRCPATADGRWPRGPERRHFRGQAGVRAVEELAKRYPRPGAMVDHLHEEPTEEGEGGGVVLSCARVMQRAKTHHLFGDWIGFKIADMIDRVLGVEVDFTEAEVFMFSEPRKSALLVHEEFRLRCIECELDCQRGPSCRCDACLMMHNTAEDTDEAKITAVVAHLTTVFSTHLAPPAMDRPVGLQEVETILCKYKSHLNGHYPLLNDVRELREKLPPWASQCETAAKFLECVP